MFSYTIILIILLISYLFNLLKPYIRCYVELRNLPGLPRRGLLGGNFSNLRLTPEQIFLSLRDCARNFYPVYKLYALHRIAANILSPEDCELVLSNPRNNEKGYFYKLLHPWLKFGLLTSSSTKWQARRKILTPAFHFNILQQFILIFNEEAEKLVQVLKQECKKSYVCVNPHITQFTLKIITETAMGTKLTFHTQEQRDYESAVHTIGKILLYRFLHPWCVEPIGNLLSPFFFQERQVIKTLQKFTKGMIEEREKNFKDIVLPKENDIYKGKKRLAMLDLLLFVKRNEGTIDNEGIQEEVDTFTFEGHDTTAVALGFILMLISCHRDVQDSIVQEMIEVLGDLHHKPTYQDLQNMKYMERCIKECLRLYPSVHFIARNVKEDMRLHNGQLLPKKTIAVIHIYDVHHNPDIYPDPEKFDPDRFLPENCKNRHPYAYLPFSAGSRNCIGQKFAMLELKAALCAILGNFLLEPIDTPETIVLVVDIVLRTKDEIKVRFVPRI